MEIDLTAVPLFEGDTIDLDKKVTVILGKNGTGKKCIFSVVKTVVTNLTMTALEL